MLTRTVGEAVSGPLGRAALDRDPFPTALCDTLFAAVLVDDEVDPDARLPAAIRLDHTQDELVTCFRLCRQLWAEGFDRERLIALVGLLRRDGDLGERDRLRFKHIRAKFKHFRYAHALYGARHRYPAMLNRVTVTMGKLQDAYRNSRRAAVLREATLLRLLLTELPVRRLYGEADTLIPTDPAAFRAMLEDDFAALTTLVAHDRITGHQFHSTRKRVGRQVSFWDTLRTIGPSPERHDMSRTLSAINGLMGDLHDRMVERRGEDRASYAAAFPLPAEIRDRIAALVGAAAARGVIPPTAPRRERAHPR
jgi:hypothetical protein